MKKLLALVLALVMTMGLATVATNAAYPDEDDISLNEAVDVMTAVGVFKGDEKGNFMPKANLDRAAAAKLIAYLDLGEKAAEALPAVKAFNDVPETHWAAKYIAYCADAGYVAGAGDGNFYPGNALTGYAFGKMILCVLGYDTDIEGFTGANWTIAVAKLMQSNDINENVDTAASANLTREQAAQYCFNALKADMVEYDTKGTSIDINGAKITTGASKAEKVTEKKYQYDGDDGVQQLCEKLYDNDFKKVASSSTDDFGAPANGWKYKSKDIGTYPDTPDGTYTGKLTRGTLYTLLGKDIVDDIKNGDANMTIYTDGVKEDGVKGEAVKGSSGAVKNTGKGTVEEVYIDDDGFGGNAQVTVIVKNIYLLQATSDYNTRTEKLSYTVLSGKAKSGNLSADDFEIANYKEDDYILYTYADGEIQEIKKAEVVSGKVESFKSGDSVTLAGTKYEYVMSNLFAEIEGNTRNTKYTIDDTAKIVLDGQGHVIGIDSVKESNDDVVFVKETAKNGFDFQAKIVTVDGKKLTVTLDEDSTDANGNKISNSNVDKFAGFMSYEIEKDGTYELSYYNKVASTAAATSIKLNKVTSLAGHTANASTVYIVEDDEGDITMYTGVKNAPSTITFTTADSAYVVYNNDGKITYVYVNATGDVEESSSSNDEQIYVLKIKSGVITDSNKKDYIEVEALVNGAKQVLKVSDGKNPFTVGKLYKSTKTDVNGYINGATEVNSDFETFSFTGKEGVDAFDWDDGAFTVNNGSISRYVKTDKVYVVLTDAEDLMDDPGEDYEVASASNCRELENLVKGYTVSANGYVLLSDDATDSDSEVVAVYVNITSAVEA